MTAADEAALLGRIEATKQRIEARVGKVLGMLEAIVA